ncbi:basic proline-rich protein-like [Rattus rattus]|uniref:basic proline-rich protein-like n=1 Tax=Rattus rattus TaxID=10117 RepID=UPI0013F30DD7|nr:basic proline-rich protein-like [Rattus rattus]
MAATPLPCCDRTTWEWGIRDPAQDLGRSPRVGSPHSHFEARDQPGRAAGARLFFGPQQPRRRDKLGSGHAAGSAAPRRAAPCSAREPRARAPRTPRPARLVLPRPPAARGGGGARPAPRSSADAGGERARGSRLLWGYGCEGRRPAGRARARLGRPHPTAVHCGAESRAAMNSAAERARGPPPGLSPPARWPARSPGRSAPTPNRGPRPILLAPRCAATSCSWLLPELGGNAPPLSRPAAPAAGCPASPRPPRPFPHPARAYLQLGTATDARRGLPRSAARKPGRDGRGGTVHPSLDMFQN